MRPFPFNPFFVVSQFAFWANLLIFFILSKRSRHLRERVSSFAILSFAVWALGDSMMRGSSNLRMAAFWNNVSGLGWCFAPALFFQAAVMMTGRRGRLAFVCLPSLAFLLLLWFTPHINSGVILTRWGYSAILGRWVWAYLLYLVLFFVSAIALLLRSESAILRWMGFTTLAMLALGSATDLVLPWLSIHIELFPVFTVPISLVLFAACGLSEGKA